MHWNPEIRSNWCLPTQIKWHKIFNFPIFRYISGSGSGWMLISKIVLRQFMLLQVLGQSAFIFAASIFQPVSVNSLLIPNPSFWSTLYIVFITEYFIMDCVLCIKILVSFIRIQMKIKNKNSKFTLFLIFNFLKNGKFCPKKNWKQISKKKNWSNAEND